MASEVDGFGYIDILNGGDEKNQAERPRMMTDLAISNDGDEKNQAERPRMMTDLATRVLHSTDSARMIFDVVL